MQTADHTSLVQGVRITLSCAVAWRVIAELMRRHANTRDIKLLQVHPGTSIHGCYYVFFDAHLERLSGARTLVLHLGGPSGTYEVKGEGTRASAGEREFFFPMLGSNPVAVIDQIDNDLGLRSPGQLVPSTPAVLIARTIALCLEQAALQPVPIRTTAAWLDASAYGPHIAPWAKHFVPQSTRFKEAIESGEMAYAEGLAQLWPYFALHRWSDDSHNGTELGLRLALFDFEKGRVLLLADDAVTETFNVATEYAKSGRKLEATCARIRQHLGVTG